MITHLTAWRKSAAVAVACLSLASAAALIVSAATPAPSQPATAAQEPTRDADDLHVRAPRPAAPSSPSGTRAHTAFWDAFYSGRYEAIPGVQQQLTAAYLENPRDAQTALLLGHTHLWKTSERAREEKRNPATVDHLVLAEHYFEQAHRLAPEDHRILGWLGSVRLPLGTIRGDEALRAEGDRLLREAVRRHPRFNHFTSAFVRASLPANDPRFQEALEQMWRNVEECSGVRSDEKHGAEVDVYELAKSADPVCVNGEKAPHNFEGFVLVLGDMLMKAGKEEQALATYERAKLAPTYAAWPYREVLESRVQNAPATTQKIRNGEAAPMVQGSGYSCAVCHTRR